MKFSTIGKLWFGYCGVKAGLAFHEERQAYKQRKTHYHGYPWDQVQDVMRMVCTAQPQYADLINQATSDKDRARYTEVAFTCTPTQFKELFGFDRPAPR